MEVHNTVDLGGGHLIEFGRATWNQSDLSIRNRYPTSTGGFSPHSSSEFPLDDLEPIVLETVKRDFLGPATAARLIEALAASIRRQADE